MYGQASCVLYGWYNVYTCLQSVYAQVDFSHYNAVMGGYCYKKCHWILVVSFQTTN